MLPILATIPALPHVAFLVLTSLVALCAVALSARDFRVTKSADSATQAATESATQAATESATQAATESAPFAPLWGAAFLAAMLFVWSQNPIKLHSYGLLLIIGYSVSVWLACKEARRRGVDPNVVVDLALPLLLVSIICCRVLYVLLNRSQFSDPSQIIRIWDGGLSFHGAFVGAISVIIFYAWKRGVGFWRLADIIAPGVFAGYAIGRIGCLLNGCCYGGACDLPWAISFPVEGGPIGAFTMPSHPAQIYSALMAMALFAVMQRAKKSPRFNQFGGQLTLLFLGLYAVERFVIEIFRNGATARTVFGLNWLTQAQFTSLLALVVIAALWTTRAHGANSPRATVAHPQT